MNIEKAIDRLYITSYQKGGYTRKQARDDLRALAVAFDRLAVDYAQLTSTSTDEVKNKYITGARGYLAYIKEAYGYE